MAHLRFTHCGAAVLVVLGQSAAALAADGYVDSVNGSDSNDGKTQNTPYQTQANLTSSCTTVHFARGSQFNVAMKDVTGGGYGATSTVTYTNYGDSCKPLPDFKLPTGTATSVFQTFSTVTIDGIKFESSHNTSNSGSSFDSGAGICVYLQGKNSTVKNCEVTDCDFGIMLQGDGSLATQNYVHDVNGQALDGTTSSDPNSVGGGKGIYAMANNVEVSYNTIIHTITFPNWTGASGSSKGGCDGGATEIAVQSGATLTGYKNHHNFAYYTCGFFQASTTTGSTGTFSNSEFSYNVMIDTAWMILAQVNNTNFVNMNWQNNTVVQHKNAGATADQGMLMEMWNGESSGVSGGTTPANQIFLTNNLMVLEGVYDNYDFSASYVTANSMANNSAIVLSSNIFLPNTSVNPGFFKLGDGDPNFTNTTDGTTMPAAADYDLTSDTTTLANTLSGEPTTISGGTPVSGLTTDFLGRAVPAGSITDIGAFQYGSTAAAGAVTAPSPANFGLSSCGSTTSTGGANSTGGSSSPSATGGKSSVGTATGATGGKSSGGATSTSVATGGTISATTGGAATAASGASAVALGTGGQPAAGATAATGGTLGAQGGAWSSAAGLGGQTAAVAGNGSAAVGGARVAGSGNNTSAGSAQDVGNCACSVVGRQSRTSSAVLIALLALGLKRKRPKPDKRM